MRATLLLSACLLLAGCGADAVATPPPAPPPPSTVAPSASPAPEASSTPPNGQDLLFSAMMIAHHGQAVRMSRTLLAKSGVPERVAAVADFIRTDQDREITEMNAWRVAWGAPAVSPDDPAAARHGAGHGMLTEEQLAALAAAGGPAATRLYLEQMIEHHTGAILMAKAVLKVGRNVYVRNLAKHIVNEQGAENDVMTRLLATPPA
ncbi:DUF305 domain-containing protein [Phytohabitans suffuscus]|uniref:DUF305 domain-containing protein n=1 Tax=Phytohabitans suffuscus TaxID=624315 RepID=A0A6F8YPY6_9ACTN|nr:DUF305 domain-containing protein [Phytohabitans suffuscus]BCB88197.1 hypothetical protein Psuf_055100 [Phytohabitans suffuscus]